jgi:hypothetical protein
VCDDQDISKYHKDHIPSSKDDTFGCHTCINEDTTNNSIREVSQKVDCYSDLRKLHLSAQRRKFANQCVNP